MEFLPPGHQAPKLKLSLLTSWLHFIITNNQQDIHTHYSLPHTDSVICTTLSVSYFFFLRLLLHVNHVQPVCTFLSCTVMLILIFKSTVYCHADSFIFCSLIFFIHFMYTSFVLYSIIFALSMERTWLTFHCWLYTLCIIVYVTNKSWTWTAR